MRRAVLLAPALLLLAACGGEAESVAGAAPSSSSAAATSSGVSATSAPAPADDDIDVTAEMQGAAGDVVTGASQTEPDRLEVQTTIVDPRGGITGSPEAQQAIAVCQAAVQLLADRGVAEPHVSVFESNGTSFVLAGHPSYGPDCTEV